jgi:hypothetical protein
MFFSAIVHRRPDVIQYPRFHGWGDAEALVDTGEIAARHANRDGSGVVLDLLREPIRQSRQI